MHYYMNVKTLKKISELQTKFLSVVRNERLNMLDLHPQPPQLLIWQKGIKNKSAFLESSLFCLILSCDHVSSFNGSRTNEQGQSACTERVGAGGEHQVTLTFSVHCT
jgi:hypothetical protein